MTLASDLWLSKKCYDDELDYEEELMNSKVVLGIVAVIGVMALCATVFRSFWFALISGGPLVLGFATIAVFLLGVFVGSSMKG